MCTLGNGPVAQLGERLICIQEVSGSIPLFSTTDASRRCTLKTEQRRKKSKATEGVVLEKVRRQITALWNFLIGTDRKVSSKKGKYNFVNIFC